MIDALGWWDRHDTLFRLGKWVRKVIQQVEQEKKTERNPRPPHRLGLHYRPTPMSQTKKTSPKIVWQFALTSAGHKPDFFFCSFPSTSES